SRINPGQSMYVASVRQVRFNAWDYSDDQVWSGLVEHLFRALAVDASVSPGPDDPAAMQAERASFGRQLAERQAEEQRVSDDLAATGDAAGSGGALAGLSWPALIPRAVASAARELRSDVRGSLQVILGWVVLGAAAAGAWFLWGSRIGAA